MAYKLGKRPARPDAVKLKMATYFKPVDMPTPPRRFGHFGSVQAWDMFANDKFGCCVWAGAAHETRIWTREGGTAADFSDADVLGDYAAVTKFNPADPDSDQGTDMTLAASYRRKTGVLDKAGNRHKIDSYLGLRPGDPDQLALAAYLFGAVGVGLQFPEIAFDQFDAGQPWAPVRGAHADGGHYVPVVGRNSSGNFLCITWGRLHAMTPAFLREFNDESLAYVSLEPLRENVSPEGFHVDRLRADLASL